jgi:hypothetical protein
VTQQPPSVPGANGWNRGLNLAGLAAVVFAPPVIAVHLVRAAFAVEPRGCVDEAGVLPDLGLLLAAVGALVAGSVAGTAAYDAGPNADGQKLGDSLAIRLGTGALALFPALVTFSLVFEAVGVQRSQDPSNRDLRPITSYVRCAIQFDKTAGSGGLWTYFLFGMTGFLVGHWLWVHPEVKEGKPVVAPRGDAARKDMGWVGPRRPGDRRVAPRWPAAGGLALDAGRPVRGRHAAGSGSTGPGRD